MAPPSPPRAHAISAPGYTACTLPQITTNLSPSNTANRLSPLLPPPSPVPVSLLPLASSYLRRSNPTPENTLSLSLSLALSRTLSLSRARALSLSLALSGGVIASFSHLKCNPNQLRWNPMPIPETPADFVSGSLSLILTHSLTLSLILTHFLDRLRARALSLCLM